MAEGATKEDGGKASQVFALPDPSINDSGVGLQIKQCETVRSFGLQCRHFFGLQTMYEAAGTVLQALNRIILRYKPSRSNTELAQLRPRGASSQTRLKTLNIYNSDMC